MYLQRSSVPGKRTKLFRHRIFRRSRAPGSLCSGAFDPLFYCRCCSWRHRLAHVFQRLLPIEFVRFHRAPYRWLSFPVRDRFSRTVLVWRSQQFVDRSRCASKAPRSPASFLWISDFWKFFPDLCIHRNQIGNCFPKNIQRRAERYILFFNFYSIAGYNLHKGPCFLFSIFRTLCKMIL